MSHAKREDLTAVMCTGNMTRAALQATNMHAVQKEGLALTYVMVQARSLTAGLETEKDMMISPAPIRIHAPYYIMNAVL